MCVHTICWELHNQAHGKLSNEHSWPPCYVGTNIHLMPAPCNLPLCGLRYLGPCHRLCNCHRAAFLSILCWWYLILSVWFWAAMIKLSVSPLSPALLNQAQLASMSTKGFSRLQKIVHALVSPAVLLVSSSLFFFFTFAGVWAVDKSKYLFFIAFVSFRREYFAFPASYFLQAWKTCLCPAQYNHSNWPWSSCKQTSTEQSTESPTSIAPLNVKPTNISFRMMKAMHYKKLPSFSIHFLNVRLPPLKYAKAICGHWNCQSIYCR